MSSELIINASLPEVRIALMEDNEIQELLIERAFDKGIVGNIYKGKVTRVLPGMQAAFVDIGLDKAAFLYVDDVYVASLEEKTKIIVPAVPIEALEESKPFLEKDLSLDVLVTESSAIEVLTESLSHEEKEAPKVVIERSSALLLEQEHPKKKLRKIKFKKPTPEEISSALEHENYENQDLQAPLGLDSDRLTMEKFPEQPEPSEETMGLSEENRPAEHVSEEVIELLIEEKKKRPIVIDATQQRGADRRIRLKEGPRFLKPQVNIQDLLKEGQEVVVQIAKDAIAAKGARLTCHISLPGRHLVCMPTINHVGVSRRIEREEERRRLKEYVEKNRPKNLGFIVRTASGKNQSEKRIRQDIEYLTKLWTDIKEKALHTKAPGLVYEDLNAVLRCVRDWVTEDTDKLRVDSRKYFNEIQNFANHFMPSLKQKIELYHGDIPIFDAYNISTELSRALERRVWLKSGGYIVIDQAEALVAIDVNTGRFVGKKNLEDTILKTNLEAVKEIAYQLRLRNCGGIIILDLIDMEKEENRHRVYRALEEHLSKDRARPNILKISELGLIEMTRKRTRDTIIRTLCASCTHCEGKGFIKSKHTVAYEVLREIEREGIDKEIGKILVQAHPDVIDILAIDERHTLDQIEKYARKTIYLQAVKDFHPEQFEIVSEKKDLKKQKSHFSSVAPVIPVEGKPKMKAKVIITEAIKVKPMESVIVKVAEVKQPLDADEEDRLVFLRAQAAQDAALALLNGTPMTTAAHVNNNGARKTPVDTRGPHRKSRNRKHQGKFRVRPPGHKVGSHHSEPSYDIKEPNAGASQDLGMVETPGFIHKGQSDNE